MVLNICYCSGSFIDGRTVLTVIAFNAQNDSQGGTGEQFMDISESQSQKWLWTPFHNGDFYIQIHPQPLLRITVAESQVSRLVNREKARAEEIAFLGSLLSVFKSSCQESWWFLSLEIRQIIMIRTFKMKVNFCLNFIPKIESFSWL